MDKKIRNAVRTFLIKDGEIVVIKYKGRHDGYFDIPGGKIEDGETKEEASIREFKEETGITITKQHYIGHITVEYPDTIYEFEVLIVDEYSGEPLEFDFNNSLWIDINELLKEEKLFPSIKTIHYLNDDMNIKIACDSNHNIIDFEKRD